MIRKDELKKNFEYELDAKGNKVIMSKNNNNKKNSFDRD